MQASLKLNTKNSNYILLTISNLDSEAQNGQVQSPKKDQYLADSNLTHSRMTEGRYKRDFSDGVKEEQEHATNLEQECPTCSLWKRWAAEQQKNMVRLQEGLLTRQISMKSAIDSLHMELESKSRAIQSYNQQLAASRQEIDRLSAQLTLNTQKMQSFIKQRQQTTHIHLPNNFYSTPSKDQINSNLRQAQTAEPSTKMSQMHATQKNGRTTCPTITKNLEWSAFETNRQRIYRDGSSVKQDALQKCRFQNTMLKQYNSVLLQRLKQSKYRKPIL